MDSEKPFDSLETEAMLEVERVEKFVWQVHVHTALMFRLEKEWRGPGRGLIATDNLHCLPRGAGLRPWMGGKGHPDQGARLWTMCQWHQLQSSQPRQQESKNWNKIWKVGSAWRWRNRLWRKHEKGSLLFRRSCGPHKRPLQHTKMDKAGVQKARWFLLADGASGPAYSTSCQVKMDNSFNFSGLQFLHHEVGDCNGWP